MAWKGVITNAGNNLLKQWTNGVVLSIVGAAAGTGVVDEVSLMAQTALKSQVQTLGIASYDTVNGDKRLRIQIPFAEVAYPLNQIGVFAKIGDGDTQLLALYQNSMGVDIPTAEESPDFLYTFYGLLGFDNTGELKVTIDPSASVTAEMLSEELAKHTNEQAPNFAQAEKLENISNGEKMTTLMGKIMKAIADLISHLKNGNHVPATEAADNARFLRNDNTWQNVTPANIGAAADGHKHSKSEITDFPTTEPWTITYEDNTTRTVEVYVK